MKTIYLKRLLFLLAMAGITFTPGEAVAQNLSAGDIIFTGYDATSTSGTPDKFSFVALANIPAGTIIYFTERGYFNTSGWQPSGGTEGTVKWTVGTSLELGNEVLIAGYAATLNGVANGTVTQVAGGSAGGGLSLSNTGDQIIAFQSNTGDPAEAGNTNIAGLHWGYCPNGNAAAYTTDETWDPVNTVGACSAGPNASGLPPGLAPGLSSIWVGFTTVPAIQNYQQASFNGAGAPFADAAAVRAAVLDKNNWTRTISSTGGTVPVPSGQIDIVGLDSGQFNILMAGLYPNPAGNEVTVTVRNIDGSASLHIIDLRGRTVLQQRLSSGNNKVPLDRLGPAVYLAEIVSADGRKMVTRLIKK